MKKLFIVDGNSIMNRAFYGVRLLSTADGTFTNAVYGTATMIKKALDMLSPDLFAVAFDVHQPTFRHEYYDLYKSNRHGMPDELFAQVDNVKLCLSLMGASIIELPGFEADDILGTYAALAEADNIQTYIMTGDRDSLQLVTDKTTVLLATNKEQIEFTPERFFEEYGVTPSQFVDVKALMGDSSDCIPGVKGIGEKTACALIAKHGSLDGVYNEIDSRDIKPGARDKLLNDKENAYVSQYLARICKDAPVPLSVSELGNTGIHKKELRELFEKLEFAALIKKFALDEDEAVSGDGGGFEICENVSDAALMLSAYPSDDGKMYFCDGKRAFFLSFVEAEEYLKNAAHIVVYDRKKLCYDCEFIKNVAKCDDIMLMAYVLSAGDGDNSLSKLISRVFFKDAKSGFEYAFYIHKLYFYYMSKLDENEKKLYFDIELPLCDVLYAMEKDGFSVDTAELEKFSAKLLSMQKEYEERIFMRAGEEFNVNSPKQLGVVLFEKRGLPAGRKTKSGYSTDADVLEKLRKYDPIIDDIIEYRQVGKLRSTYAEGLLRAADENGRIHTSFRQALTATGRLSSIEPNLQNIPIKTELGREFRRFFKASSDDMVLIDADYSQIELRILAAISGDEGMIAAFNSGYDIHTATAMRVFGVDRENVTLALRKRAKAINFGIVYGMSDYSLAGDMHVSKKEASMYIESYFATYPGVRRYLTDVVEAAKRDKYVTTILGRRRFIPELSSAKKTEIAFGERVAMNSPIQGSAADIIKLAMINTFKRLRKGGYDAHLILQVHDELIIESNKSCADEVEALLRREMENAMSLPVKLDVDISRGKTWYEAK